MKTLADLKRDAKTGTLEGRITLHSMWGTDLPERLKGWRKIVDSNTVAIFFLRDDGKKSELRLEKASLVEYTGGKLTVYYAGFRDLTEEEKRILNVCEKSLTSWDKFLYLKSTGFEYLKGYEKVCGKKYDPSTNKIQDDNIKGTICMQYEIRKAS